MSYQPFLFRCLQWPEEIRIITILADEKTGSRKGSDFSQGTQRGNGLNLVSSGLKFFPLDHAAFSGVLTPAQERHTYLIQSSSGLHLSTLWDHHRQLGFIVGACGNILGEKAQWWLLHSDTPPPHTYWCLQAPRLRTGSLQADLTTVCSLADGKNITHIKEKMYNI